MIERAQEDNILGYLLKPVEPAQLGAAISVAYRRFREFSRLRTENEDLQETIRTQKLVNRAKGILQNRYGWSEAVAFRRIQKLSMDQHLKMSTIAEAILNGKPFPVEEGERFRI